MNPLQWCNGCLCDLGLHISDCKMSTDTTYRLPLNVYVIILGIGLFIFMLSMIFCCYLFSLRRQGTREQYGYNEVVLKGAGKKLSLLGQTCAVCLEEFRSRDELGVCPCSHAFHKKCLVKWLEIRSVCPMCNKPICRLQPDPPQGAEGLQNPLEVEEELCPGHLCRHCYNLPVFQIETQEEACHSKVMLSEDSSSALHTGRISRFICFICICQCYVYFIIMTATAVNTCRA
ncbi:hypothetical protein AOLI_G00021350 [Acnodon oligacanthus]